MSLFVFSANSIIGISIRKKTLVPKEVFKFASKAMYIQHVPQVEAVNTDSSFNANAFFDEKQIVHSSIHLPHFLHHTIYTHTHSRTFSHRNLHLYRKEIIKLFADFYTQHHANSCSDILDANVLQKNENT